MIAFFASFSIAPHRAAGVSSSVASRDTPSLLRVLNSPHFLRLSVLNVLSEWDGVPYLTC